MTSLTLADALARDAADPLAHWRERFDLPEGVVYLDGNSLGALPRGSAATAAEVIGTQWGRDLITSWNAHDWIGMPQRIGDAIAALIGADAGEVVACDSTSVNLFKLIAAALEAQPGRQTIVTEAGNFPTDVYVAEGAARMSGGVVKAVPPGQLLDAIDDDTALLLLTHVHYTTGRIHDMAALTRAAHDAGALVLWDLSHSAGALPVGLNECVADGEGADFAVGCGYKYLNGGPGAPAFAFVAERHHAGLQQPLTGWMGHASPFAFTDDYAPGEGMARLLCGTPPILGLAALEVGVDLIAEIGIERLYAKSQALSEFFRECLDDLGVALDLASPTDAAARGSQLSFRHPHAYAFSQALIARGVIGDFRDPDILRLGFAPAYVRFEDIAEAARHLAEVLASGEWQREEFAQRSAVT